MIDSIQLKEFFYANANFTLKYDFKILYHFQMILRFISVRAYNVSHGKSPIDRSNHVPHNFANYSGVISFARKKVPARRASSD